MEDVDELIRYEPERTTLDFKRAQYPQEQHEELLKDLIAMANAHAEGDRLIIVGVKKLPDNTYTVHAIPDGTFIDAATYQELVAKNIEPDLAVEYVPHRFEGQLVGVLRIVAPTDRPYVLKKKFGKSEPGSCWIRRGTTRGLPSRADFDRMYAARFASQRFQGAVRVTFDAPGDPIVLTVEAKAPFKLPSEQVAAKIRKILGDRAWMKKHNMIDPRDLLGSVAPLAAITGGYVPLEDRSDEALRRNLRQLREDYREHNDWFTYHKGECINFALHNEGSHHLEDALLSISFGIPPGVIVFDEEYADEPHGFGHTTTYKAFTAVPGGTGYPDVEIVDGRARIHEELGDLRHYMSTSAFPEPLRITFLAESAGAEIPIEYTLRGKNLPQPVRGELRVRVVPPSADSPVADPPDEE